MKISPDPYNITHVFTRGKDHALPILQYRYLSCQYGLVQQLISNPLSDLHFPFFRRIGHGEQRVRFLF